MGFDWTLKITDLAIVFATLVGPILAIQAQKHLESIREVKQRRISVFRQLMATRAVPLSDVHVAALNNVPLEFYGDDKKLSPIIDKWKIYFDHLHKDDTAAEWGNKRVELLVDFLRTMGDFLGYNFHTTEISNEVYFPKGHAQIQTDQEIIRRGLASLLGGKWALPMQVVSFPSDAKAITEQEDLRRALIDWLNGNKSVSVKMSTDGSDK